MIEHIKPGEKNKRSRAELVALTGYSDRRANEIHRKVSAMIFSEIMK
jgi:hypothetical protein